MISIKKYWQTEDPRDGPLRVVRLLLQGIGIHAVEGDSDDYEAFRADVAKYEGKLESASSDADLLFAAGAVMKTLEDYNRSTTRFLRVQAAELQAMVTMLTQTIAAVSVGGSRSVERLQEIEKQVENASAIDDVRLLKVRLSECLTSLREETERQKETSTRTVAELSQQIEETVAASGVPVSYPETDLVTGLAGRMRAEEAIRNAISAHIRGFIAIFVAERVQLINSRFGYAVGDQVLLQISQKIAQGCSPTDQLFRWTGPAFLALFERQEPIELVQSNVARIIPSRMEKTVQIGTREVLLPLSANTAVFPLVSPTKLLLQKIDTFVASQLPRESVLA